MANVRDQPEYQLEIDNHYLLIDDKKFNLLKKIDSCGSIRQASQQTQVPYRTALKYIEIMEKVVGSPVVHTQRGGKGGGGASQLAPTGKLIIKEYQKLNEILQKHSHLNEIEGHIITRDEENQVMGMQVGNHEVMLPLSDDLKIGDQALILLSPEDIFIMLELQESSVRNILPGKIVGMELKNKMVRIKLDLGNNVALLVDITPYSWEKLNLDLGSQVFAGFKATSPRVIKI
ncbi:TOBE domain-containing protein [Methanobacterium alkalithermotolerans]|uniref:TOBE domain-containing protein n=1 Tax=Methanobacterium alkalithermotolerans TaxID=2731220 RepID=A0A8T8K8K3_9EURY|nr:TOBE domain-containing protein [Methanobacterium alkalithermotolerans]QUH23443.1 TOBE domain-containing protein [Methanobacterium alkalithermotolerans]